jgi:hypothetical protein
LGQVGRCGKTRASRFFAAPVSGLPEELTDRTAKEGLQGRDEKAMNGTADLTLYFSRLSFRFFVGRENFMEISQVDNGGFEMAVQR